MGSGQGSAHFCCYGDPNITTERAVQELQARSFTGKYTVVHRRLRYVAATRRAGARAAL